MAPAPRISILLHERTRRENYGLLMHIARVWQRMKLEVELLSGVPAKPPPTDLLIPHIDLTRRPPAYREFIGRFPRVLNRHMDDISKRQVSRNLLNASDRYDGPVIVKTDLNFGGTKEAELFEATAGKLAWWTHRARQEFHRRLGPRAGIDFKRIRHLTSESYPVFASPREVPRAVWSNPALVVERFMPEREDDLYCIRVCLFLGKVALNRRIYSRDPIIKGSGIHSEAVEVPGQLLDYRRRTGFDYGKIDYVVHDGQLSILDTNITPGGFQDEQANAGIAERLAVGIEELIRA